MRRHPGSGRPPAKDGHVARLGDREHTVYWLYGSGEDLLYVGCTSSFPGRLATLAGERTWFQSVHKIAAARFPTRTDALNIEREVIERDRPRHNVMGNPSTGVDKGLVRSCGCCARHSGRQRPAHLIRALLAQGVEDRTAAS